MRNVSAGGVYLERKISTFGNAWHSDFSFLEEPPLGSVLMARSVMTVLSDPHLALTPPGAAALDHR